ncbi:MAG: DUF559 domain-containing protein [Acidimicrobiia bacterium]|nr:DUF559 domain-containing protein [Acidimicrobiia bacterium]
MTTSSAGVTIRRMAESQNGLVTGEQAISAGLSRCVIRRRVRLGEWKCVGNDTYLIYGAPSAMVYLRAAVLAFPAVVSHQSAAQLHGLGYGPFTGAVATVPSRRTYRFRGVQVHQSTDLDRRYVTHIAGFPVTNPIRTLFDLASVTEIDELLGIAQKALARRRVTFEGLAEILEELGRRGRPGTTRFRKLLEEVSPGCVAPESVMEEKMIALLSASDLPMPTLQMPLPWRGPVKGRADFAYENARVIIECDGRRWHTTMEAFEKDRRRDNLAQLNGWRVLRFTWHDLTERPARVLDQITQALRPAA